jgi:hypothetical protein
MDKLQKQLNLLWASKVIAYHFDMLLNKILFILETVDNGEINMYELSINSVSLFYFINNVSDSRKNIFVPDDDDYLEFTSINILEDVKVLAESQQNSWINQYNGEVNVCIEIWNKLLVIEASSLELNNINYSLDSKNN